LYFVKYGLVSFSYKNTKQIGVLLATRAYKSIFIGYQYLSGPKEVGFYNNGGHGVIIGKMNKKNLKLVIFIFFFFSQKVEGVRQIPLLLKKGLPKEAKSL